MAAVSPPPALRDTSIHQYETHTAVVICYKCFLMPAAPPAARRIKKRLLASSQCTFTHTYKCVHLPVL